MLNNQLIDLFESARPNLSEDQASRLSLFINQAAIDLEYFSIMLRLIASLMDKKNEPSIALGDVELKVILSGLSGHAGLVSELLAVGINSVIWFEHITSAGFQDGSDQSSTENPGREA